MLSRGVEGEQIVPLQRAHFAYAGQEAFAAIVPDDADVGAVAEAIVKVVDSPFGQRPFRVHVRDSAGLPAF
jgi:hypothetical protein